MADLYVAACNDQCWVAAYENTVMTLSRSAITPAAVRMARQLCRELREQRRPILLLTMLGQGLSAPPEDVKVEACHFNEEFGPHITASAVVLFGDVLWRSNMRMVMQSFFAALPYPIERTMRGNLEQAARWLEHRGGSNTEVLTGAIQPCLAAQPGVCCGRRRREGVPC